MFTGIVEEVGSVVGVAPAGDGLRVAIKGPRVTEGTAIGDSISVSGVCLTVTAIEQDVFTADVMRQSITVTAIGDLRSGTPVNLERAVTPQSRLGGHIVQGHVDAVGQVLQRTPGEAWEVVRISLPADIARYVVDKGSITVSGVSLTVSAVGADWFEVSLIPATLAGTTLGQAPVGTRVNLETDVLARHVERLLEVRNG